MTIAEIKKTAGEKMAKSVETLKHDLSKVRTGRAHTGLIDHLRVDYYGSETPINQVASVTLSDARTIAIQHLKELLKEGEVGEDQEKRAQDEVQKLTDKSIADIDKLVAEKEKDLMAV